MVRDTEQHSHAGMDAAAVGSLVEVGDGSGEDDVEEQMHCQQSHDQDRGVLLEQLHRPLQLLSAELLHQPLVLLPRLEVALRSKSTACLSARSTLDRGRLAVLYRRSRWSASCMLHRTVRSQDLSIRIIEASQHVALFVCLYVVYLSEPTARQE
jgi:hypothetical protein